MPLGVKGNHRLTFDMANCLFRIARPQCKLSNKNLCCSNCYYNVIALHIFAYFLWSFCVVICQ